MWEHRKNRREVLGRTEPFPDIRGAAGCIDGLDGKQTFPLVLNELEGD